MTAIEVAHALWHERLDMQYPLPAEADVRVAVGDTVTTGTLLARIPTLPVIVPYAALVGLTMAQANSGIMFRDGVHVDRGTPIARHRGGLRTRVLTAPVSGTIRLYPDTGVCEIQPPTHEELFPRRAGIVQSIGDGAIVVSTTVERLRGVPSRPFPLCNGTVYDLSQQAAGRNPPDIRGAIALIGHCTESGQARALQRQGAVAVIVGTVSDALAWELQTALTQRSDPLQRFPLLVVNGPGNVARGETSIAALRTWHGQRAWVMYDDRGPSALVETGLIPRAVTSGALSGSRPEMRDPAHWGMRCAILDIPQFGRTDTGVHCVGVTGFVEDEGQQHIPIQNLAF